VTHVEFPSASLATAEAIPVTKEIGYIGLGSEALFVAVTRPRYRATEAALICPPLHADFARNYRGEVILAEKLAAEGIVTARPHYRGLGHSSGDPASITLESMTADIKRTVELIQTRFDAERVVFIGCRLGGYVAAAAAASYPTSSLVMWDPVLEPSRYLREATRAVRLARLAGTTGVVDPRAAIDVELEHRGFIDVHGYPIRKNLVVSLVAPLPELLGGSPRPLLLLQFGRNGRARADYLKVEDGWRRQGFAVESAVIRGDIAWWSRGTREGRDEHPRLIAECVAATVQWITHTLSRNSDRRVRT
jgi:pimeloyl-ACP methyl ester carboxylesterase